MRVLLTGASSFTGLWIARALAEAGAEVVAFCRGRPEAYDGLRRQRIERVGQIAEVRHGLVFGDPAFLAETARAGPFDVLALHHAEVGDFRRADYEPLAAAAANTRGLAPTLTMLRETGLRRIVLTGSVFESDEGDGDRPLVAISDYGLAKTLTATIVRHEAARAGIELLKITLPSPFGAFQSGGLADHLLTTWLRDEPAVLHQPDQVRDFLPVELFARHYARLALEPRPLGPFRRSNPSGFVDRADAFARMLAQEMQGRLGKACETIAVAASRPSGEPRRRFNTEPVAELGSDGALAVCFDHLAAHYRDRSAGRLERAA